MLAGLDKIAAFVKLRNRFSLTCLLSLQVDIKEDETVRSFWCWELRFRVAFFDEIFFHAKITGLIM
jgi:hypothetical protein